MTALALTTWNLQHHPGGALNRFYPPRSGSNSKPLAQGARRKGDGARDLACKLSAVKIAIGSDHAGFELKSLLVRRLASQGHEVVDFGTDSEESVDYPLFCAPVARAVAQGEAERGIVLGGSGQGEQISANKVHGARAALCNDLFTARLCREHNDANVLSMGARIVAPALAFEILHVFLTTQFEGGRHTRRLEQISAIEQQECAGGGDL